MNPQSLADRLEAAMRQDTDSHAVRAEIFDCIDTLRQAAAEVRGGGWLPIESAPRNELEDLILFGPAGVYAGQWWEGSWITSMQEYADPQPTHWQPLPSPPGAVGEGDPDGSR